MIWGSVKWLDGSLPTIETMKTANQMAMPSVQAAWSRSSFTAAPITVDTWPTKTQLAIWLCPMKLFLQGQRVIWTPSHPCCEQSKCASLSRD